MIIDDSLIEYLEALSRLRLSGMEKERAKSDLAGIIDYMAVLGELDTDNTSALSQPFPAVNRFREDEVQPSLPREDILSGAADKTSEYFKAPKTIE